MDWDLNDYFPGVDHPSRLAFAEALRADLAALQRDLAASPVPVAAGADAFLALVARVEDTGARLRHLSSYAGCLVSADSRVEAHLALDGEVSLLGAELAKAEVVLLGRIGAVADADWRAILARPAAHDARLVLELLREQARSRMSDPEETLAADLAVDGIAAWDRMYGKIAGTLEFTLAVPGQEPRRVAMAERRALLGSADRAVREAAFRGGNAAWEGQATPCSSALNAIAGTRLSLNRRRGGLHYLQPALLHARMSRGALDAMFAALGEEAEVPRRFLRWRAGKLGLDRLSWWDLDAPLPGVGADSLDWQTGCRLTGAAFDRLWPEMGDFFRTMLEKRWFDHTPRPGRRPGGFSTSTPVTGQSRIFMTFRGAVSDVMTLAHEVGHSFHSAVLAGRRPFAQEYPMTLAETASTLGEGLLVEGIAEDASADPAFVVALLDAEVRHAASFLLDIPMRYTFERRFHDERAAGELPVSRFRALMVEEQRRWFGDALAEGAEDPMFWASKLHFYIGDLTFYNFPYTVGYLLSRGLMARRRAEGPAANAALRAFLERSSTETCDVAARNALGEDLADPDFWRRAIRGTEASFLALQRALGDAR